MNKNFTMKGVDLSPPLIFRDRFDFDLDKINPIVDELNLSEEDSHLYWLTVLFFRGDYYDFNWAEHHDNLHKFPKLLLELTDRLEEEYGDL